VADRAPAPIVLVVPREAAGARLDLFVVSALAALDGAPSRATVQRWIEHRRVRVDGILKKSADKLKEGARVLVEPEPPPTTELNPDASVTFQVLHTDSEVIVLNKPPGLVVHPARGHESGTLVHGLLALGAFDLPALGEAGSGNVEDVERARPGIVHRLDKGTSGVMVVARTARAREALKAQFQAHTIEREYEAICVGHVSERTFDTLHGRHPRDRMRFTTKVRTGKRAITHVLVLESLGKATHVVCRLETGRTHQIRVHLSEAGTPILADPLYGKPPKSTAVYNVAERLGHQALHARLLGFVHPTTDESMRFTAPPPSDFVVALTALRAIP
jgi:23S rRNA pseudouridine1911/1915/1917 synthase